MLVKMKFNLGLLILFALTTFNASVDCKQINYIGK